MEKQYWLGRKRASLKSAQNAVSAVARLIHYDLAGRYSLKALSAEAQKIDLVGSLPRFYAGGKASAEEPSDA